MYFKCFAVKFNVHL